jgi:hypothetical protein
MGYAGSIAVWPRIANIDQTLHMKLDTTGRSKQQPFLMVAQEDESDDSTKEKLSDAVLQQTIDPFRAVSTRAPPPQIKTRDNHPVPRLNIVRSFT